MRIKREGLDLAADVNVAIAVNRGEPGAVSDARAVSHGQVVQAAGASPRRARRNDPPSEPNRR